MPILYQPNLINVDFFLDTIVVVLAAPINREVILSDDLNNWLDLSQSTLFDSFLELSDDNSANWSDSAELIKYTALIITDDLNSWSDTTTRFMTRLLKVEDNLDNWQDDFKINEFQNNSDDLNNWNDEVLLSRVLINNLSDTNTISDAATITLTTITTPKEFSFSDDLNGWADVETALFEKRLNVVSNNSFNWNNLLVHLKT